MFGLHKGTLRLFIELLFMGIFIMVCSGIFMLLWLLSTLPNGILISGIIILSAILIVNS